MKPHKWAKEIKAWADGAEIESRYMGDSDAYRKGWELDIEPVWGDEVWEFRIKPQPKEPQYLYVYTAGNSILQGFNSYLEDLSDTWKYIGKIKLEIEDGGD